MTVISQSVTDHPQLSTYTLIYGMTVIAMIIFLLIRAVTFMKVRDKPGISVTSRDQ